MTGPAEPTARGVRERAWAWVDGSLPPAIRDGDAMELWRARLCVVIPVVGVVGGVFAVLLQAWLGRPWPVLVVASLGACVGALGTQLIRWTRSVTLTGHALIAAGVVFMSISAALVGGLGSPRAWALVLLPLLAALLLGWRAAAGWTAVLVGVLIAFYVAGTLGVLTMPPQSPAQTLRAHGVAIALVMALILASSVVYERAHSSMARALAEARDAAADAANAKAALVANVSHELRTPLNGVLGSVDLLERSALDPTQLEHVRTINRSAEALLRLVNDLLDASRLEAGGLTLERASLSLRALLEDSVSALAPIAEQHRVTLVVDVDEEVEDRRRADPLRIRQVVTNLASNALKFTEDGVVVVRARSDGPERVVISVEDTGVGIAQSDLSRLFDAFEQAELSTARRYGGTGLGLSIAQQLAHLMGGEVTVESELGVGSTFALNIPMTIDSSAPAPREPLGVRVRVELSSEAEAAAATSALRWLGAEVVDAGEELLLGDQPGVRGATVRVGWPSELAEDAPVLARPFGPASLARAITRALRLRPTSRPPSRTGRGRVLVADDNETNRRVMSRQLAHLGFSCDAVQDGDAAIEALTQGPPLRAALIDARMPEVAGIEVARAYREWLQADLTRRAVPLFMVTANEDAGQRAEAREAGFDAFYMKPLRIEALEAMLSGLPPPSLDEGVWSSLEELAEGDPEFLDELVSRFIETTRERVAQMEAAEDEAEAKELAHVLKGAAGQIGASRLRALAAELEAQPSRREALRTPLRAELTALTAAFEQRLGPGRATAAAPRDR